MATLRVVLWIFAVFSGLFGLFGGLNDGRNTYPLPLLLASGAAVAVAELLLPLI